MLSGWRSEVIVRFVDIGGIIYHRCLKFAFIIWKWTWTQFKQTIMSNHFVLEILFVIYIEMFTFDPSIHIYRAYLITNSN